jgi:hypothetical protein
VAGASFGLKKRVEATAGKRVEFHALVERGSSDVIEIVAEGFATGGGAGVKLRKSIIN